MKKSSNFLLHVPDVICCYRALASLAGLILGPHWLTPWLFSTALISDLWDGWFYRKYVARHPNWKPWNPLPLTLDPMADLTLICCGVIFGSRYYLGFDLIGVTKLFLLTAIVSICFVLVNNLAVKINSPFLKMLGPTVQTHVSCFLMVYTTAISWKVVYGRIGALITVSIFYLTFAIIGDKSRLIRRID
mgnify:FL=1